MEQKQVPERVSPSSPQDMPGLPLWAVLLPALLGGLAQLAFLLLTPRPELFPPWMQEAPPTLALVQQALLFSFLVALVSLLGGRLAGSFGALGAGLMLSFNWAALLLVPLAPLAAILALGLVVVSLLFVRGGRAFSLALAGLLLLAALLVVPIARESSLGLLWRLPIEVSWERLLFWRAHSALGAPLPLLGFTPLFALALSSLLVLRSRREGHIVAGLLLVSLLVMRFVAQGPALLLFILALLCVLSAVWMDAAWRAVRSSHWRAFAVLILPAILLMLLGSRVASVDAARMAETELEMRLERVSLQLLAFRVDEAEEDVQWAQRQFPEDRRVRLAEAQLLLSRKQYRDAARAFKNLRREYPEWRQVLMGAGWADFYSQSYVTSEMHFREILAEEPDNARALVGLGACAIYNSKNYKEAERLLMEGLAIDEEIAEGHHNMALLLIQTRALYESEENMMRLRHHAQRCMELDPTNDDMRRFVRRGGWPELLPEDERPEGSPTREETRP